MRHPARQAAQAVHLVGLQKSSFQSLVFRDVFDDGNRVFGRLSRLAKWFDVQIDPYGLAVLVQVALFPVDLLDLSRRQFVLIGHVNGEVVGMGQLHEGEPEDLFLRVPQDFAGTLVHLQELARG